MNDTTVSGVSFDFGQTLAGLDETFLAEKLARLGLQADAAALAAALPQAWAAYDRMVRSGANNHPWKLFMATLLEGAKTTPEGEVPRAVEALWVDQPHRNLWRKPIPGMIELCRDLVAAGAPIGVLTNSEGKAAELLEELGWRALFRAVVDSGKVGVDKPDRRIFAMMADALALPAERIVHVGDSLGADVEGAVKAGMRAVWFGGRAADAPSGAVVCQSADELRASLRAMGLAI